MNKVILVDFDGVIHKASRGYGKVGEIYDEPMEGAVYTMTNLINQGYKLIVFTAREESEFPAVKKWLDKYGFPEMTISNRKVKALAYIDDRAIRFTSWKDIVHYFI